MNWTHERWVKLYIRSEPDFLALTWQARGLFRLLLTEVDPAGLMKLGKSGRKSVAVAIRAPWVEIEPYLQELIDDGCIVVRDAAVTERDAAVTNCDIGHSMLVIPNFVDAQEARSSDRARQAEKRAKSKAALGPVLSQTSQGVTAPSQTVTPASQKTDTCHTASRDVTARHDQKRSDQRDEREQIFVEEPTQNRPTEPVPQLVLLVTEPTKQPEPDPVEVVFGAWRDKWSPKSRLDDKRRKRIEARLAEGYDVQTLIDAITNAERDPFLMGENPQGKKYTGLETLLRDASQVDRLASLEPERDYTPDFDSDGKPDDVIDPGPGVPPPQEFLDAFEDLKRKIVIHAR